MDITTRQNIQEDEINLLDYWRALVRRKRLIGLVVGAAMLASVITSLCLPKIYAATARVLPPENPGPAIPGLARLPASLSALALSLPGLSTSSDLWVEVLNSETVLDNVIRRFDLMKVYHKETIEDTRKALARHVNVRKSKPGVIFITVKDRDPKRAADMANAFVENLDNVNRNLSMSSGTRKRVFLEKRLEESKRTLAGAEDALKKFQEANNVVKPDAQSQAIINTLGRTKGLLMAKEVELRTLLTFATPANPQVGVLKSEVDELKNELGKLEVTTNGDKDIFIPTGRFPGLAQQYARLLRDLKIQETLYELLVSQYEQARIEEAKDSPTVQVLDKAVMPTKKAGPHRAMIVLFSTFGAFLFSVVLALFLEYVEALKGAR